MKYNLITLFLLLTGYLQAQNVNYVYDNAGNRISRTIIISSRAPVAPQESESSFFQEILSDHTIKIYPNPTKGWLSVEIPGISSDFTGEIRLFDANGRVIQQRTVDSRRMDFDLSNVVNGIYFMQIIVDGQTTRWKVIKIPF